MSDENPSKKADAAWTEKKPKIHTPLIYRRMSDVKSAPINWLWPGRIAKGKIMIIAGNPGLGKSQFTAYLASIVTTGGTWPVSSDRCDIGNVAFICAEDDAADTIKPRLEAAGADVKRIIIVDAVATEDKKQRSLNLQNDILNLDAQLAQEPEISLLIIDPISAYMGTIDSHKNADVRGILTPLAEMAARRNVAVVCVSHLNKGKDSEAMMRVTGSLAYVAAARSAFLVVQDKETPNRRLFLPMKNNLSGENSGLAFTITSYYLADSDIDTSKVVWENGFVYQTANDILAAQDTRNEDRSALSDAKDFLIEVLAEGPLSAKAVQEHAKDAGVSISTLGRAKKEIRIKAQKLGMKGGWAWVLPTKNANFIEDRHD